MAENAFGILANYFQVLLTTMQHHLSTVQVIVKACINLHNLKRIGYPGLPNPEQLVRVENRNQDYGDRAGTWKTLRTFGGNNTSTKKGKKQMNLLKHWANSAAGVVPWQDMMI